MILRTDLTQGSRAWLDWRHGGIGGSAAGAILLGDQWPYPDSHRDKLLDQMCRRIGNETNFAMRRGTRLEPLARARYEIWAGVAAPPVCVEHADEPWIRVSLDGLRADGVILELKCPSWHTHSAALAGVVPAIYRPQCQWQLLCLGADELHYGSFCTHSMYDEPDQFAEPLVVTPDGEMQAELLGRCADFLGRVIEGRKILASRGVRFYESWLKDTLAAVRPEGAIR